MNLEDILLSEISLSQRTNPVGSHLSEVPRVVRLPDRESRMLFPRGWERAGGNGELVFNGHRVSVLQDGRSSGDG